MRKLIFLGLLLGSVIWFAACGGSGNNNNNSGTVTSVTVSCSPGSIFAGQTSQCTATVQGTGNFSSAVTWTASTGTISSSGLFTGPGTDTSLLVTITATSTQNTTISGTAQVTVNPNNSTVTGVSVTCNPTAITPGQTSQCAAAVSGTGNFSQAVTWTTNNTTAQISSTGILSYPQSLSSPIQVTVTATSQQTPSVAGTFIVTVNPGMVANNNVAQITVDAGPPGVGSVDIGYVSVTVCAPSTNTCQTIDHVQVDTGSEGLRLLSSASGGEFNPATLGLQQETISGSPVDECLVFADGYVWGPVYTATVTMAGETASSVPIQVIIPASASPGVPQTCSSQNPSGGNGNEGGSLTTFGANGIIGVGPFQTDCGQYCVVDGQGCGSSMQPCVYYQCPSSGCVGTNIALNQQLPNPVAAFTTDNNGVLIQLPTVPDGGSLNPTGSLIFGIGTQSNNSLGLAANVYPIPDSGNNAGDIITTYMGQTYPQSFLDSGSNGLFFLDSTTTGIPTCANPNQFWYCPTNSPDSITVMNQGQNASGQPVGSQVSTTFMIEDATTLFNTNNTAFSTLGGPNTGTFDFGLAFFFGKNVFTAIDGASTPGGTGPFFAY